MSISYIFYVILMMEAASPSETSVNFYQTSRRSNPSSTVQLNEERQIKN
jgi:hypothetical protein